MSETKFTRGPWKACGEGLDGQIEVESGCGKEVVCLVLPEPEGEYADRTRADAALIAAAPELYEALDALTKHYVALIESGDCGYSDPEPEVQRARAALAKARGNQ